MKANMKDPDFLIKKERMRQETANKVLKDREERNKKNEVKDEK